MVVHSIQYCTHHIVCWQKGKNRNKQNELNSRALWCDHEIKQVDWEYVLISQLQNLPAAFGIYIYTMAASLLTYSIRDEKLPWSILSFQWPFPSEFISSVCTFFHTSNSNLTLFLFQGESTQATRISKQQRDCHADTASPLHHHLRCEQHNTIYQRTVLLILQFSFSNLFYSEAASGTQLVLKIRRMQNQLDR